MTTSTVPARRRRSIPGVTRSDAPRTLEEDHDGQTFSRHLRYSLTPSTAGTSVRVDDDISFKGLGKLAATIATRDIKHRWHTSLERLKATAEAEPPTQAAHDHASRVPHP